jgi:hypothetical protein
MRRATDLHRAVASHPDLPSVREFEERYLLARHKGN